VVTDEIQHLTADEEDRHVVAQANSPIDETGRFTEDRIWFAARWRGREVTPAQVDYMTSRAPDGVGRDGDDPFLEHDTPTAP